MTDPFAKHSADAAAHLRMLGYETHNIAVYEPQITATQGEGFAVSYPTEPTTHVTAAIAPPSATSDRSEAGTDTDVDTVLYAVSDAGVAWVGYGESDVGDVDAAAIVELPDGFRALVSDYEPQSDGLDRLDCTETDR